MKKKTVSIQVEGKSLQSVYAAGPRSEYAALSRMDISFEPDEAWMVGVVGRERFIYKKTDMCASVKNETLNKNAFVFVLPLCILYTYSTAYLYYVAQMGI